MFEELASAEEDSCEAGMVRVSGHPEDSHKNPPAHLTKTKKNKITLGSSSSPAVRVPGRGDEHDNCREQEASRGDVGAPGACQHLRPGTVC